MQFFQKVDKLHHLVSTASQAGILNTPFQAVSGTLPVAGGVPVEDHIRAWHKQQVLTPAASVLEPLCAEAFIV